MSTPNRIQNNGIELNKPNDDLTITLTTTNGLDIEYDLNSVPKEFKLNENGVYWTNGVQTFQTSLNRLCAIEQAFTSIELPPTPNVLKVNDTITITDGNSDANLTNSALTFYNINTTNTYSLGVNNNDFVMNSDGDRLLLNSGNNDFYIGEYTSGTAPVINSTGSSSKTLYLNSRDGITNIGDTDGAFNTTTMTIDDMAQTISSFSNTINFSTVSNFYVDNQNISAIGDVANNSSQTKMFVNASTQNIDIDLGGGNGSSGMNLRMGDINGLQNQTKILLDDVNKTIYSHSTGEVQLGDITGIVNGTKISCDVNNQVIDLVSTNQVRIGDIYTTSFGTQIVLDNPNGTVSLGNVDGTYQSTKISINDNIQDITSFCASGTYNVECYGVLSLGDYNNSNNLSKIIINDNTGITNIKLEAINGVDISRSTIKYATSYYTTSQNINDTFNYSLTFNGNGLTATLPSVSSSNVGIQFLITNTNSNSLTVVSTGGQVIYSTITGGATSRTLAVGHSQVFTAIKTTSNTTYGWSML